MINLTSYIYRKMNPKEVLSKYAISPIVDIICDYAYHCKCVGHPLAPMYCDYCCRKSHIKTCELTKIACTGTNTKIPEPKGAANYIYTLPYSDPMESDGVAINNGYKDVAYINGRNNYFTGKTRLGTLHFTEFIHNPVVSGGTVDIPLDEHLVLVPLIGPFPLKKIMLSFPAFKKYNFGQIIKIVFYDLYRSRTSVVIEHVEVSKNVINASAFTSISTLTQTSEWYASDKLVSWIKIG
ncbi:MAG: hypothetical protein V3W20_01520 [Candidatus Neomarinimicrobiota bacterium]